MTEHVYLIVFWNKYYLGGKKASKNYSSAWTHTADLINIITMLIYGDLKTDQLTNIYYLTEEMSPICFWTNKWKDAALVILTTLHRVFYVLLHVLKNHKKQKKNHDHTYTCRYLKIESCICNRASGFHCLEQVSATLDLGLQMRFWFLQCNHIRSVFSWNVNSLRAYWVVKLDS